ncbi:MAG: hypothetical protein R2788_16945 [Saprospiraceae bacterium]
MAVIWPSQQTEKPILKLTNRDYMNIKMVDLVTEYDTALQPVIRSATINTITGHSPLANQGMNYKPGRGTTQTLNKNGPSF